MYGRVNDFNGGQSRSYKDQRLETQSYHQICGSALLVSGGRIYWVRCSDYLHLSHRIEGHLSNSSGDSSMCFYTWNRSCDILLQSFWLIQLRQDKAVVRALITREVTGFQKRKQSLFRKISNVLFPFWTAFISRRQKSFWFAYRTVPLKEVGRSFGNWAVIEWWSHLVRHLGHWETKSEDPHLNKNTRKTVEKQPRGCRCLNLWGPFLFHVA